MTITKRCSTCREQKDISNFPKNKASKDGLAYRCRECQKTADRKNYALRKAGTPAGRGQTNRVRKPRKLPKDPFDLSLNTEWDRLVNYYCKGYKDPSMGELEPTAVMKLKFPTAPHSEDVKYAIRSFATSIEYSHRALSWMSHKPVRIVDGEYVYELAIHIKYRNLYGVK